MKKIVAILLSFAVIVQLLPPPRTSAYEHKNCLFTMNGAILILKNVAEIEFLTPGMADTFDVDRNGKITIADAVEVLKHVAEMPSEAICTNCDAFYVMIPYDWEYEWFAENHLFASCYDYASGHDEQINILVTSLAGLNEAYLDNSLFFESVDLFKSLEDVVFDKFEDAIKKDPALIYGKEFYNEYPEIIFERTEINSFPALKIESVGGSLSFGGDSGYVVFYFIIKDQFVYIFTSLCYSSEEEDYHNLVFNTILSTLEFRI